MKDSYLAVLAIVNRVTGITALILWGISIGIVYNYLSDFEDIKIFIQKQNEIKYKVNFILDNFSVTIEPKSDQDSGHDQD